MPLNPLRPAPAFNLQTLANGQVLDVGKINEFQKCMAHLAGRGATIVELAGARANGKIRVPLGLVSKGTGSPPGNTFRLAKRDLAIPLWLNPGHDTLSIFFSVKLNSLYPLSSVASGFVGSVFTVSVVRGGNAYEVIYKDWHELDAYPSETAFFHREINLASLFLNSPVHVEEIYLKLHYTAVEGHDELLGNFPSGTLTNPEYYQGCSYFCAAAYKSLEGC